MREPPRARAPLTPQDAGPCPGPIPSRLPSARCGRCSEADAVPAVFPVSRFPHVPLVPQTSLSLVPRHRRRVRDASRPGAGQSRPAMRLQLPRPTKGSVHTRPVLPWMLQAPPDRLAYAAQGEELPAQQWPLPLGPPSPSCRAGDSSRGCLSPAPHRSRLPGLGRGLPSGKERALECARPCCRSAFPARGTAVDPQPASSASGGRGCGPWRGSGWAPRGSAHTSAFL